MTIVLLYDFNPKWLSFTWFFFLTMIIWRVRNFYVNLQNHRSTKYNYSEKVRRSDSTRSFENAGDILEIWKDSQKI